MSKQIPPRSKRTNDLLFSFRMPYHGFKVKFVLAKSIPANMLEKKDVLSSLMSTRIESGRALVVPFRRPNFDKVKNNQQFNPSQLILTQTSVNGIPRSGGKSNLRRMKSMIILEPLVMQNYSCMLFSNKFFIQP